MKYIYTLFIICLSYLSISAQDIIMQDGSIDICNGNFLDSGGQNGDYNNNESFIYTICPEEFGFTVLEFSEFDIEDGVDTMIIYNSDTNDPANEIGTFTGNLADNPELQYITSDDDFLGCLTIEFISNDNNVSLGWAASISCREGDIFTIEDATINTCVGLFTDTGDTNAAYNNNENFIYTICPDVSNLFTILEFQEFQLQNGVDTMIIYDSDTNDPATEIGTFTGSLADNTELQLIAATENNASRCLTIEFVSDASTPGLGWVANIKCQENRYPISNNTVNACEGLFSDSGGVNTEYSDNENFVYTICSDDSDYISVLEFEEFQLQEGGDSMIIYDSDTNDPAFEIGTFTGNLTDNPELQSIMASEDSPSGCLTVEFISDDSSTDVGWSAYISCKERFLISDGPTVNTCSGNFYDSGGQDGDYTPGDNFVYTICPDGPDLRVILEFSLFAITNDGQTQMSIYDGNSTDPANLIDSFTGNLAQNPELEFLAADDDNTSGCLTIQFNSSPFPFPNGVFTGWEAAISCRPPCQDITPEVISVDPICSEGENSIFVEENQPTTFVANAETSSGNTDDLTYEWEFNNTVLTGQTVTTTFNIAEDIDATLTVTDSFGCFETIVFPITVGGSTIVVEDDLFSLNELINGILVDGACSKVENITSSNNASLNGESFESFGYFNKGCTDFPFEEGIVMGSADINRVIDGNGDSGSFGWPGDPDLDALIQDNTNNATVIEFEFTSYVSEIEFNYLFTSYEYPTFVCNFADTFAFILSGPGISDTNAYDHDGNPGTPDLNLDLGGLNIALVPETNTPVSPVNVHDESCNSGQGEFAFPEFYDTANSEGNNPGDIDVTGRTKVLTAKADVIPFQVYTIKLVIADRGDTILDSFVFIEGGSFNLGAEIGDDKLVIDATAPCEGDTVILEVFEGIAPQGFTFEWYKDDVLIPGETGPTIAVTETGEYRVEPISDIEDCGGEGDSIVVEFTPKFDEDEDVTEDLDIIKCTPFNDPLFFDLTTNEEPILENIRNTFNSEFPDYSIINPNEEPYTVSFYETQQNAIDDVNPILNPSNYSQSNLPYTIYYAVECNVISGCDGIGSFIIDATVSNIGSLDDLELCSDVPGTETATFDLTENNINVLNGEDPDDFEVRFYESEQNAIDDVSPIPNPSSYENISNPQTIWAIQDNLESAACFDIGSFVLEVYTIPDLQNTPSDLEECGDFTLTQTFDLTENNATSLGVTNAAETANHLSQHPSTCRYRRQSYRHIHQPIMCQSNTTRNYFYTCRKHQQNRMFLNRQFSDTNL